MNNTGNSNTGNSNTGDCNAGDSNIGNNNKGSYNIGYGNLGDSNIGNNNAGDNNTGFWNLGDWNTGDWNTGDWNTGYCNTITSEYCLIFNKPAKRSDWEKAIKPSWMYVSLTEWINETDMTDKEKEAYPTYVTTGGYLRCYSSLKEAYVEAWEKASNKDKKLTFELPNFDIEVFKQIFGFTPIIEEECKHVIGYNYCPNCGQKLTRKD